MLVFSSQRHSIKNISSVNTGQCIMYKKSDVYHTITQGFILVRVHGTLYVQFEVDLFVSYAQVTGALIVACNVQIEGSLPCLLQSSWIGLQDPIGLHICFLIGYMESITNNLQEPTFKSSSQVSCPPHLTTYPSFGRPHPHHIWPILSILV